MAGFFCKFCGKTAESTSAKCSGCGAFNALVPGSPRDGGWVRASGGAVKLSEIERKDVDRIKTGTRELDRVLAGGFAIDGAYILSGSPGAGKSTLTLQVLIDLADMEIEKLREEEKGGEGDLTDEPYRILIAAAEETKEQIAGRSDRLLERMRERSDLQIFVANQNDVLEIEKLVVQHDPDIVVADSAQTLVMGGLDSPAGSVTTVKACATYLCGLCKARKCCLILVAHVTKDDELAGPKMFEHLVDGVLHLSNEEPFRVLRASKHRFGPTTEVGLFSMTAAGLKSVENPSELLLANHLDGVSGSVIGVMVDSLEEGASRALLVEIQALASPSLAEGGRQTVTGLDAGRVRQIAAVLSRRLDAALRGETFVSLAGGIKSRDAGLDLPIALAILSSLLDEEMPEDLCCFGEIGLAGEVRAPRSVESRLKSAMAMGFSYVMGPPLDSDLMKLVAAGDVAKDGTTADSEDEADVEYVTVRSLSDAIEWLEWDIPRKASKKSRKKKA